MANVDLEAKRHKYFFERLFQVADVSCKTCGWNNSVGIDGELVAKLQTYDGINGTSLRSGYFKVLELTLLNLHASGSQKCANYSPSGRIRKPTEEELVKEELTIITPTHKL